VDLRLSLIALLILLSVGCTTRPVPDTFMPLEELVNRPFNMGASITTIHNSVWINDIDEYLRLKPEGSPLYTADMIHERIHSIRMGGWFSTIAFIAKYIFSSDFMWEEERICWYYELVYLKSKGIIKPYTYTASFLTKGYTNILGSMINYEDALKWVKDVYDGNWKPNISEEEADLYYNIIIKKLNAK
jgi:hypothetical protein